MNEINFSGINRAACTHAEDLLHEWLPGGKVQGQEYVVRNPKRADNSPGSFRINMKTGKWADFATDDRGGDLVSLYAYLNDVKQDQAAKEVLEQLRLNPQEYGFQAGGNGHKPKIPGRTSQTQWRPLPYDPKTGPKPIVHPEHGDPDQTWPYRNEQGQVLMYACRFDKPNGDKVVLPLTLWGGPSDRREWRWKGLPEPRPLYNLDKLIAMGDDGLILVVEGEKAADAAQRLFPDYVVTTSPAGSKSAHKADWGPLKGRNVIIWPDADEPGLGYAKNVAEQALEAGAAKVRIVALPDGLPKSWDLADKVPEGWDPHWIIGVLENAEQSVSTPVKEPEADDLNIKGASGAKTPPAGEILLRLAREAIYFHTPNQEPFAAVGINGHDEIYPVDGDSYRQWLAGQYYREAQKGVSATTMQAVIDTIKAWAVFDGQEQEANVRIARYHGDIYLDLARPDREVVAITSSGWSIIKDPPVSFFRPKGMLPLPLPESSGDVSLINKVLKLEDEQNRILIIAWLVGTLHPEGPYPLLLVQGEHGSGKSVACELLQKLIDPCKAPLRFITNSERDLMIMAQNRRVLNLR